MDSVFTILGSIFAFLFIVSTAIMTPFQCRYINEMQRLKEERGMSQNEVNEKMPVQEDVLHMNLQSNLLFIPANILAELIYKYRHR